VDGVAFRACVFGFAGRISIVTSPPPPSWSAPACTAALQIDESSVYGPLPITWRANGSPRGQRNA